MWSRLPLCDVRLGTTWLACEPLFRGTFGYATLVSRSWKFQFGVYLVAGVL